MKNSLILITGLILSILLFGCTQAPSGSALMALDSNKNTTGLDKNTLNSDSNVYDNLNEFKKVKIGNHIAVDYTGRLTDGTIFDSSIGREPLEFDVGAGQMIKGFDDGVIGMKINEKKTITIQPEQAYGVIDSKKLVTVDKNSFAQFDQMKVGMIVSAGNYSGKIIAKTDSNAIIDFNHELAGKTLIFEITLISIE